MVGSISTFNPLKLAALISWPSCSSFFCFFVFFVFVLFVCLFLARRPSCLYNNLYDLACFAIKIIIKNLYDFFSFIIWVKSLIVFLFKIWVRSLGYCHFVISSWFLQNNIYTHLCIFNPKWPFQTIISPLPSSLNLFTEAFNWKDFW